MFASKKEIVDAFELAESNIIDEIGEILSNDMKKGDFIQEHNCWYGEIIDNMKGNTRVANIHGYFTEAGSIYVWDIATICKDGKLYCIKLTNKQKKDRDRINTIME